MISEDVVVTSIKQSLETLRSRIETLIPTTLCHIGEAVVHDARQIYASFLKTPQDETLDLCILLRLAGPTLVVSGDLVKGGSGDVLGELEPITSPEQGKRPSFSGNISVNISWNRKTLSSKRYVRIRAQAYRQFKRYCATASPGEHPPVASGLSAWRVRPGAASGVMSYNACKNPVGREALLR